MLAFYAQIKAVHVAAVLLSGALFLTRGLLVQAGRQRWAMSGLVRYASYSIDTVLLTAALMLVTILPGAMFANHWLTLKVALLFVYVALGTLALKRAANVDGHARCASSRRSPSTRPCSASRAPIIRSGGCRRGSRDSYFRLTQVSAVGSAPAQAIRRRPRGSACRDSRP